MDRWRSRLRVFMGLQRVGQTELTELNLNCAQELQPLAIAQTRPSALSFPPPPPALLPPVGGPSMSVTSAPGLARSWTCSISGLHLTWIIVASDLDSSLLPPGPSQLCGTSNCSGHLELSP